jgi:hypothetical protein
LLSVPQSTAIAPDSGKKRKRKVLPEGMLQGVYTEDEEKLFLSGLEQYGRDWKKVAFIFDWTFKEPNRWTAGRTHENARRQFYPKSRAKVLYQAVPGWAASSGQGLFSDPVCL